MSRRMACDTGRGAAQSSAESVAQLAPAASSSPTAKRVQMTPRARD
eukprot:CAMPEP_0185370450 /NCGR_PEP_ID=MMETSP1364-20130426/20082_1 /TAXON_ID=38817 /ORGANISM="Gephyrocapsa oceanica, Strain RCC1303" /LENGTH=45 /DNA_ID= /DNA_START= /DNA_END= /DNA_ORIENTATION=